ncbi:hypothetical protein CO154_00540 [Candidatus Pacearchaeota archaeon CG_4_9_14_3_um_filter_31_7]|nr:MAG: hypothetical protein COU55_02330 [Candidatus Pacearchaeota archaeon CG10_big_fil_rev_8_21_14_0_10_31_59]PIZ80124.1 MAG: hypothetical protein COX99_03090 [Candidatus Pacearchaeota archaeon CG_4_10_14_0_2_um_filter_31_10]PJA70896.1 MAG: hypothetical protein CO154_00540 [Candidatus Pacearchaeota archaeon CG_4_9_14_3_um_filter_31_7]
MIEELKNNLEQQSKIIKELQKLVTYVKTNKDEEQKKFFNESANGLIDKLIILNNSIPLTLENLGKENFNVKTTKLKGDVKTYTNETASDNYKSSIVNRVVTSSKSLSLSDKDKSQFRKDLGLEDVNIKKFGYEEKEKKIKDEGIFKQPGNFVKTANKFFGNIGEKIAKSPSSENLRIGLRKANLPYLVSSYVSSVLLIVLIAFIVSLILGIFFSVFKVSLAGVESLIPIQLSLLPIESILPRLGLAFLISIVISALFLIIGFTYPKSRAKGIQRRLSNEIAFAVMHMAAISSSGIEPTKIFTIISNTKEYPLFSNEAKKITHQINLYGYDLVTALKNVSKTSPSDAMIELFNGIATTINSGGSLNSYLNEKARDFLNDYKLLRQKYISTSATYADVYTGLLIAAPLIFMLMLVLVNVIGVSIGGLTASTIAIIGISAIVLLNIGFIIFLQVSQPDI